MRRHSLAKASILTACGLAAIGCSKAEEVDLGKSKPAGVLGASLTDYAGAWEGYAEAFKWADRTDFVRLSINASGNGALQVGDTDAPPPDLMTDHADSPDWKPPTARLLPGFDYPIAGATVTSRRIRITSSSSHALDDWCGGFEPVEVVNPTAGNSYFCIPNVDWSYSQTGGCRLSDADNTPVACDAVNCNRLCTCTKSTCSALPENDVLIDAALANEGEELTGTLVNGSDRINIRMMRIP